MDYESPRYFRFVFTIGKWREISADQYSTLIAMAQSSFGLDVRLAMVNQ